MNNPNNIRINKGFCSYDDVWKGLDKYPDGTEILWKNILWKLTSHMATDKIRSLGLDPIGKFIEPKRNEKCFCKSNKKYKKCCLNKWSRE
jgi:hypothetical protein